jgi:type II secretory pathway pseudopilin PulG
VAADGLLSQVGRLVADQVTVRLGLCSRLFPGPVADKRGNEGGFTIIESMVALTLIFMMLLGSMTTMSSAVKGIVTSRQQTVATAKANQVIERARAAVYDTVGHDLTNDDTLAADPLITGSPRRFTEAACRTGTAACHEVLASSNVNSDLKSPFFKHRRTEQVDGVTYTTWAYATMVVPENGDAYKRVVAVVQWGNRQYGTPVADTVRLESLVFPAEEPPDPLLQGAAEADAGTLRFVEGSFGGEPLEAFSIALPFGRADVDSRFVRSAQAVARTPVLELITKSSDFTPAMTSACETTHDVANAWRIGHCLGAQVSTIADNDAGTAPVVSPPATSGTDSLGGAVWAQSAFNRLELQMSGTSTSNAEATITHSDGLPYARAVSAGPTGTGLRAPFSIKGLTGDLFTVSGPITSEAIVDRVDVSGATRVTSEARVIYPSVGLLRFGAALAQVTITPSAAAPTPTVGVRATSGSDAVSSTVTHQAAVSVAVRRADGTNQTFSVIPGTAFTHVSGPTTVTVDGRTVTYRVTATGAPQATVTAPGAVTRTLRSWLTVRVEVQINQGATVDANFSYELDYGNVSANTKFQLP